jgi:ketosteroid isomerase-like protein
MRFAILLVLGCTHGTPADKPAPVAVPKEVVAAGHAAVDQWRQAYEVKSVDALEKLYAHDADVAVVQDGVSSIGWASVRSMLEDRLARASQIHVRLKDVQVASLAPTIASAVATMSREVSTGATTVTDNGTLTLVLRKDGEAWVIALEHYSYRRP